MKLAFRKPTDLLGHAINFVSGGRGFCHVELILDNGLSFSSDGLKDKNGKVPGVRIKKIEYSHPKRWEFVDIKKDMLRHNAFETIDGRMYEILGKDYDFLAIIFWHLFKLKKQDQDKWYCSEAVAYALNLVHPRYGLQMTPNDLYLLVKDLGCKTIKM